MSLPIYVALCLVVPAAWGVVMYFLFNLIGKRREAERDRDEPPPIDYSI
jgi:hypothetical protein